MLRAFSFLTNFISWEVRVIKPLCFDYYYGAEADQFSFYRIPRVLMTAPHFKKLSSDAKILYGLMLDRMSISMKNGWIDNNNRVYIFFTLEDVQENLSCSHTTGVKILAELDTDNGIGLIERIKQGQGRPTRIYVKNFNLHQENSDQPLGTPDFKNVEVKTSKKLKSRPQGNGSADLQNVDTNQTYLNQNKNSYIKHQSIYQGSQLPEAPWPARDDVMDSMETYREIVHENIEYVFLVDRYGVDVINEYVQIMLDAICSRSDTVRVDRGEYPSEVVKSRLLKLNYSHIEYVLSCMDKNTTKVRNIKNYLLTALYNSYVTIDNFYRAEVNHDLYGG